MKIKNVQNKKQTSSNFLPLVSGLFIFIISLVMLFLFETYSVKKLEATKETRSEVVSVSAQKIDSANEGKLIHVSGHVMPRRTVTDKLFGISHQALWLKRKVEMYQWKQKVSTSKKRKYFIYSKVWSQKLIDSESFKERYKKDHANPTSMPYESGSFWSKTAAMGEFTLSDSLMEQIENLNPKKLALDNLDSFLPAIRGKAKLYQGDLYISANPAAPVIGDIRVSYSFVEPQPITIVSVQSGNSFKPYATKLGEVFEMARPGILDIETIYQSEEKANVALVWGFRVFGLILFLIALALIFKVLVNTGLNIPLLKEIVHAQSTFITFLCALALTALIAGIVNLLYQPVTGLIFLAVVVVQVVSIKMKLSKSQAG